jgi:uncharacterized damage-inducible protein DinB
MAHPLVDQLRFTRSALTRSVTGVTEEEGFRRFGVINSIGWIVGHVANQEQRYWILRIGQPPVVDGLQDLVGSGRPASTPSLAKMLQAREAIVAAADRYLDSLSETDLLVIYPAVQQMPEESTGTLLQRVIYHQWFHNGEVQAIRQLLGHKDLPQFVGNIGEEAPYRA